MKHDMKKFVLCALGASLGLAHAQEADEVDPRSVGSLPYDRQGAPVDAAKESPYGLPKQVKKVKSSKTAQLSEEDQIREILLDQRVTGRISGKKVLLGDIVLEEGEYVDDVIVNQQEVLLVKEITKNEILIEWVEQSRRTNARQMKIPIQMQSGVRTLLKGRSQSSEKLMHFARKIDEEEE